MICPTTREQCTRTCADFDGRGTHKDAPMPHRWEFSYWCQAKVAAWTPAERADKCVPDVIIAEATR